MGVNDFILPGEKVEIDVLKISPEVEKRQIEKLAKLRAERDNGEVERTLKELRKSANDGSNLLPRILACTRCYSTLGEIIQVLREEFGEYKDPAYY